ncbi:guanylate-binding protein 4-like isoform X3 [Durio zibethinus]|uniref:Guanylate-binding protein 4-like isoform X3 n=1 Tax=Durio zibethinus TaxID=66656 RepID=A0A6P5WWG9_DURZI|nr:guanylate-binding protein 4-like isoform X3 [Durio zibethinus]
MMKFLGRGKGSADDVSPQSLGHSASPSSASASPVTGPARPIRLLYCDEKGKFRMDPEAVAALQLVKEPIGVVSVCGRARQGKSFILNQLLGRSSGFQVASTHRPCTKGLWLWSAPLKRTALDGTEYNLLLLDTEGIDAYDQTGTYSTQIFSLAVLLSSMFIYNQIRDSIRALFPDRECFPLVRPLNNENDLQRLDQILLDKLRPEFRAGLDALTKFVFERTRPKQVGATLMTGPVLIGITESYLDALNNGAVPTISSSWQSVEEAECQRAYDSAAEIYMSTFDRSKPPEEVSLREAHEEAVQRSLAVYNASAVGVGSMRKKYEELLQKFFRRAFEDYKKNAFMEADLQCSNAIHSMGKRLRAACHASDAGIDNIVKVLDALLSEYEASCHGPGKWQKLAVFLQQSMEGPLLDFMKRVIDQIGSERSSLILKCRSIDDKMKLLKKQLEDSEKYKSEYVKRYDDAINDKKKLADEYSSRMNNLQGDNSSLKERCSSLMKALDAAKQETLDWRRNYDQMLSKHRAKEDQATSEIEVLKSRSTAAEARLAAAREQAESAQEEAEEWKRKYDFAIREAKAALEKAAIVQDRTSKETQLREDTLREEFSHTLAEKEVEIKDKSAKIEQAEQCLMTLKLELKAAESKNRSYDAEISSLKVEIRELADKLENANTEAMSFEREAKILEQEKIHLEEKYSSEFRRFAEVEERCRVAEKEAKKATELADKARAESVAAQKEKSEIQRMAMERLAQIERAERQIENLVRQKTDLEDELHRVRMSELDAVSKVALLEARVEERQREIESLLKTNNEQRASTVKALEDLLDSERAAHADANDRAEALSLQLQAAQAKLDSLQQELTSVRLNETALDSKLKTASHGKRLRADDCEMGVGSVQDMDTSDRILRANKKPRSTTSPLRYSQSEDGRSVFKGDDYNQNLQHNQEDYTKFTVQKLKQELTKHNFGGELLALRNANKKEILALYEKCVLQKS